MWKRVTKATPEEVLDDGICQFALDDECLHADTGFASLLASARLFLPSGGMRDGSLRHRSVCVGYLLFLFDSALSPQSCLPIFHSGCGSLRGCPVLPRLYRKCEDGVLGVGTEQIRTRSFPRFGRDDAREYINYRYV